MKIRRSNERGHLNHGWLDTYHTFSFGDYYDPAHMGYHSLRVINEDRVAPSAGFPTHGHRDMEIITYVLEGELEHKDSMGNGEVLRAGEFQQMTAGAGITHSEFNPSTDQPVHLYQIWIMPNERGLTPSYAQRDFGNADKTDRWLRVVSGSGEDNALTIHQDAELFLSTLSEGSSLDYPLAQDRHAWLQILRGAVEVDGETLQAGDAGIFEQGFQLRAAKPAEVLLFDLA